MVIQCIILYTLLYILNISFFFFLSATKKKDLLEAQFGIFLSLWKSDSQSF